MSGDNVIPFARKRSVTAIIKDHWATRYQEESVMALGRVADLLRFKKGMKRNDIIEFFSMCIEKEIHQREFETLMMEYDRRS